MPRTQISIKLDQDLLTRVDELAEAVGSNRTAVIEQAVKNDLPEQEAFYKSLENPAIRTLHKQLSNPRVLRAIAKIADLGITDDDIEAIAEKGPRQRAAAKSRSAKGKAAPNAKPEGGS